MTKFSSYFIEIELWQPFHYIYLHLTIFGIWSNNIQSARYVICVIIVRTLWYIGLAIWYTIWIVGHLCTSGVPFCVLTVKRAFLPLTDCRASLAVLKVSIIRLLRYDWLSGYWRVSNTVPCAMETGFLNISSIFYMAAYEWMHPKYDCRICKYFFCIHAKSYKHISTSHYESDVQSMNFCCKSSYWFFSHFSIQGYRKFMCLQLSQYWPYRYIFLHSTLNIVHVKPSEIFIIFELFPGQILWRAQNKWKFLTFYLKCAISRKGIGSIEKLKDGFYS